MSHIRWHKAEDKVCVHIKLLLLSYYIIFNIIATVVMLLTPWGTGTQPMSCKIADRVVSRLMATAYVMDPRNTRGI